MSEDRLKNFLKTGKDWSRLKTNISGVFVLKLPAFKGFPSRLAVELNPADESGNPKKRRGLVLRYGSEVEEFRKLFQFEKISKLFIIIDAINPKVEDVKYKKGEDVIEL